MGEEPKNETKPKFNGNLGFVWLIGILVILLGCTIGYVCKLKTELKDLRQTLQVSTQTVQNEKIKTKNYYSDFEKYYGEKTKMGRSLELNYASVHLKNKENDEYKYIVEYYYVGEHAGELWINGKKIEISGNIKDFAVGTNFDGLMFESTYDIGKRYDYSSTLYILFENGSIYKINTDDIKKNDYKLKEIKELKDIDRFVTLEPMDSGIDTLLWCIDKNGSAYKLDLVIAGN